MTLLLRVPLGFCFGCEDVSGTRDSVSSAIQTNFVKNTPLRVVFSTLFSVFGYHDETPSLVFDILLLKHEKGIKSKYYTNIKQIG